MQHQLLYTVEVYCIQKYNENPQVPCIVILTMDSRCLRDLDHCRKTDVQGHLFWFQGAPNLVDIENIASNSI